MMKPETIGLFQGLGLVEANLGSDLLHLNRADMHAARVAFPIHSQETSDGPMVTNIR